MNSKKKTSSAVGAIIAASALLVGLGACAAPVESESAPTVDAAAVEAGVIEATELVAEGRTVSEWIDPGPAIKNPEQLEGKSFFYIANGIDLASIQGMMAGMKEAAEVLGMKLIIADGKAHPAEISNQIDRAIAQGVDIIATTSFAAESISGAMASAKAANIPVLLGFAGDPGLPSAEEKQLGVAALMSYCYSCAGKTLAQLVTADSGGKANVVIFDVPESPNTVVERESALAEFERLCPECKVEVRHAPLADWSTNLQSLTTSTLRADPTITHIVPVWDSMTTYIKPGIEALNMSDDVKIMTYNAELPQMKLLAAGDVVAADVGSPLNWAGWALFDQAARVLSGMDPAETQNIPNRVFDSLNIDEVDLTLGNDSTWYGVDHKAEYSNLWGKR